MLLVNWKVICLELNSDLSRVFKVYSIQKWFTSPFFWGCVASQKLVFNESHTYKYSACCVVSPKLRRLAFCLKSTVRNQTPNQKPAGRLYRLLLMILHYVMLGCFGKVMLNPFPPVTYIGKMNLSDTKRTQNRWFVEDLSKLQPRSCNPTNLWSRWKHKDEILKTSVYSQHLMGQVIFVNTRL